MKQLKPVRDDNTRRVGKSERTKKLKKLIKRAKICRNKNFAQKNSKGYQIVQNFKPNNIYFITLFEIMNGLATKCKKPDDESKT